MEWILEENVEALKKMVLKEGWLIENLLNQVLNALKERDDKTAMEVLKKENEINLMDMRIREKALIILSTMMPMARNLRMVTGSFIISGYFQEISEKTVEIAKSIIELVKEPQLKPLITIPEMTRITLIMLRESMRMFADNNIYGAEMICEKDAEIDNFYDDIRKELMVYMMEDSKYVKRALILLEISKRLEEIADLATKIVETTSYIITGKQYKCFKDKLHTIESLENKEGDSN